MTNNTTFDKVKTRLFPVLKHYVPIVDRVHGEHHPEFHEVRSVFESLVKKTEAQGTEKPELSEEFNKLKEITDNYTIPGDVCESYTAVYNMLAELDSAYLA